MIYFDLPWIRHWRPIQRIGVKLSQICITIITSVAVKHQPQAARFSKPRGDPHSMIFCKSWNTGACSSPRESCRFRHNCDRNGCGGAHRRIHCTELARMRGRSPGDSPCNPPATAETSLRETVLVII